MDPFEKIKEYYELKKDFLKFCINKLCALQNDVQDFVDYFIKYYDEKEEIYYDSKRQYVKSEIESYCKRKYGYTIKEVKLVIVKNDQSLCSLHGHISEEAYQSVDELNKIKKRNILKYYNTLFPQYKTKEINDLNEKFGQEYIKNKNLLK